MKVILVLAILFHIGNIIGTGIAGNWEALAGWICAFLFSVISLGAIVVIERLKGE